MTRPIPDRDSAPWWAALTEHRLLLQRCAHCSTPRFAPRALCGTCYSFEWTWSEASGHGTVASWMVSHRSFQPGRATPYTVVLVRLWESDTLVVPGGWCGSPDGSDLMIGVPVETRFFDLPNEIDDQRTTLLHWDRAKGVPS